MLQKNLNVSDIFLWFFQSIFCFTFLCNFFDLYAFTFTNTTSEPSHHNHTIIPHSNHHTKIIPKSFELRNIYIYAMRFKKCVSFFCVFAMMMMRVSVGSARSTRRSSSTSAAAAAVFSSTTTEKEKSFEDFQEERRRKRGTRS